MNLWCPQFPSQKNPFLIASCLKEEDGDDENAQH